MPRVPAVDPSPDEVLVKAELDDLVPEALRGGPLATALRISPRQTNGAGSSSSNGGSNGGSNGSGNGSSNGSRGRQLPPFKQGCPPLLIGGNGLGEGMYHSDDVIRGLEPYLSESVEKQLSVPLRKKKRLNNRQCFAWRSSTA